MTQDKILRKHLVNLLKGKDAHVPVEEALADLAPELRGRRPRGAEHSPWELLEHMRIALWDILEFTRNPEHVSPQFPSGYWPVHAAPENEAAWEASVKALHGMLAEFRKMAENEANDLFAPLPQGEGQTILREILVAAEHTSYHTGQLVLTRRLLGAWE
jgi:hypothetical protein